MPSNDELRRSLLEPRDRLLRLREDDLSDEDGDHWVWVFAARAARGIKQCEDAGLPVVAEIRQRDAKLNAEHRALAMRKQNGEELSEEEEIFLSGCSPDKEPWEWPSEEDEKYEPGVAVDAALNPWASCFLDICDIYGANGDRTFGGYRVASYATRQIRPEDWRQRAEDFATTCKSIVDRFLPDEITTDRRCAAELAEILRLPEASPAPGAIGGMTGDEQKEVIKDILHFSDSVRACLERLSDLFLWTDSADPSAVGEMEAQEFRDNYKSWGSDIAEAWMTHDATRGALMIAAKGFTLLEWPHASGHHATLWLCMMLAAELKESVWESGESDDPFDIPSATAGAIFDAVSYVGHLMDVPRVFEECSLAIDREKRIIGTAVQLEDPLVLQRFMQGHRVLDGSIGEGITKERKAKRKRSEAGKKGAKTKAQRKEQQQMALTDQLAKARAAGVHDVGVGRTGRGEPAEGRRS